MKLRNAAHAPRKKMTRQLSAHLFRQMLLALFLYTLAGAILYFSALFFFSLFTWQGFEPIYLFGIWCREQQRILIPVGLAVGYLLILHHYWIKPFQYLQDIVAATEQVHREDDQLIALPDGLSDLETQLNQIKVTTLHSQRAAREAEQRKNDLVTYLAHDLKTPITSVIGYLTLLRDEPDISPATRTHYQQIALDKAERLDDLINEFFEITRFNLSHITLEKQRVDLTLMLQQLLYEFQPMLQPKNLRVALTAPDALPIYCDPDKLQRVFDNLLRNAVNYSYESSQIRITASVGDGQVTVIFENDGDTIPAEKLSRLFEQFYRLDAARGTRAGGAGLGLAIAREIVELHGGSITADSRAQVIRFTIVLPMYVPPVPDADRSADDTGNAGIHDRKSADRAQ